MIIIKLYLLFSLLVILHEMAHYIFIKINKVVISSIEIGNLIHLKIGKLKLSPFIFSGNIIFDVHKFNSLSLSRKAIILLSGLTSTLIIYFLVPSEFYLCKTLILIYFIGSCIPLPLIRTDTYLFLKILISEFKMKK